MYHINMIIVWLYTPWTIDSSWFIIISHLSIYINFLNLYRKKIGERLTLRGEMIIITNGGKISVHRFIATTLFRMVKWPHSLGNTNEWPLNYKNWQLKANLKLLWGIKTLKQLLWDVKTDAMWNLKTYHRKRVLQKIALLYQKVFE